MSWEQWWQDPGSPVRSPTLPGAPSSPSWPRDPARSPAPLEEGRLPVAHPKALVTHSAHCDDLTTMGIDDELALKACSQPAPWVTQEVQRLLPASTPTPTPRPSVRAARATAQRDVQLTPGHDDQASLWLTGPAPALTRLLPAAGHPGPAQPCATPANDPQELTCVAHPTAAHTSRDGGRSVHRHLLHLRHLEARVSR